MGSDQRSRQGHGEPTEVTLKGFYRSTGHPGQFGGDDQQRRQPEPHAFEFYRFGFTRETGSWDDVQIFLERLNEQEADTCPAGPMSCISGICLRAGTTTAYLGECQCLAANYNSNMARLERRSCGATPGGFLPARNAEGVVIWTVHMKRSA